MPGARQIEPEYRAAAASAQRRSGAASASASRGCDKSFGDVPVLRGIDLEVPAGQFLAIVGKSGCGKSTLLRLLVGLDEPTGGRIAFIDGRAARRRAPNARIVFQEPRLLPWESVAGNVAVGLGDGGSRAARDAASRWRRWPKCSSTEKAGEWPARLSGGQRQRVALARALVSRPGLPGARRAARARSTR